MRLSFGRIVHSEWSKLFSIRAPAWVVLATVMSPMLLSLVLTAATAPAWSANSARGTAAALDAIAIGALPVGFLSAALGLICMGAEYTEDSLSVTLSVAPRRRQIVCAKALLVAGTAAASAAAGLFASLGLAWLVLSTNGYSNLPAQSMFQTVLAISLGSALLAVIGLGCTAIHRSALSASIHLAIFLALAPTAVGIIVGPDAHLVADWLPGTALQAVATQTPGASFTIEGAPISGLSRGSGMLVLAAWAAVYLFAALTAVSRRSIAPRQTRTRARTSSRQDAPNPLRGRLTTSGVFRSETLKFLTLPATWWLLGLSCFATISLSILQAVRTRPSDLIEGTAVTQQLIDVSAAHQSQVVAVGVGLTQLLLALLGSLAFTTEFTSGNIRPTMIAVPRRGQLFTIKVSVVAAATAAWTLVTTTLAAGIGIPVAMQMGFPGAPIVTGAVIEAILRCVITSTAIAIIGCAIGALTRSAIPAVGAIIGILVLSHTALGPMQLAARGTPLVWLANLNVLFPAPTQAVQTLPVADFSWPQFLAGDVLQLDPNQALLVTVAWALILTVCAFFAFRSRPV
ncbi:membrane protein of unknown function [Agreia sp. COWG]|nr:membrane protein of unknown function [Agreia sp. COWG]